MKVKLLFHTPIDIAYLSAKTCYSSDSAITIQENESLNKESMETFLKRIIKTGHLSTVEGINFSFAIEGVSRALMAQLTRHRIGVQFSVQSQRYVQYDNPTYYEPETIINNREADAIYNEFLNYATETYKKLLNLEVKPEDARMVLPNATCTNITMTMNLRALIHLCSLRLCTKAQTEIRQLVKLMVREVLEFEPWLKDYLVPQCESIGYCQEAHRTCGRKPTWKQLIEKRK